MEVRKIGNLEVAVVGLGCNNFGFRLDRRDSEKVVHAALGAGINFFDTSDSYGQGQSEEFLAGALGTERRNVVIGTKFATEMKGVGRGASPGYIRTAVEASLRRLKTDYLDLYQLHRPDPEVPVADTLGALNELVREGKVREIGCSNFSAEQLREAEGAVMPGAARFVSVQNEYSMFERDAEEEVLPECERLGIAFLPYYPLANGLLTGKYRRGVEMPENTRITDVQRYRELLTNERLDMVEKWAQFAESRGHTLLDLAFAWLLRKPAVSSVIAGATSAEQVRANAAAGGWRLDKDNEVDAL